jgi:hypothetical protein
LRRELAIQRPLVECWREKAEIVGLSQNEGGEGYEVDDGEGEDESEEKNGEDGEMQEEEDDEEGVKQEGEKAESGKTCQWVNSGCGSDEKRRKLC